MTIRATLLTCCLGGLFALAACADKAPVTPGPVTATPLTSYETGVSVRPLSPAEALDLCRSDCDKRLTEAEDARATALRELSAEKDAELAKLREELKAAKSSQTQELARVQKKNAALERMVEQLVPADYRTRTKDLQTLRKALGKYHDTFGAYPVSPQWSGLHSLWGPSTKNWIPGLAPEYIPALPRDPRLNANPEQQYIYRSDGTDYKLLAHKPGDCSTAKALDPELIDPVRGCDALGVWTSGAKDW